MGVLLLKEAPNVPIWLVDVKRMKLEWFDPCRPISSRFDNHGTSILHNYVPLEISWINS